MEININFVTVINLVAIILGMVSGLVMLFFSIRKNRQNIPLALGHISLSIAILISLAIITKLIIYLPFLFRVANVFGFMFLPMPLIYLVFNTRKRLWRWYDFLHFIPVLIYVIDLWPIFTLSLDQKTALILQDIHDPNLYALVKESRFFGPGFYQPFRTILFSIYWVIELLIVVRWIRSKLEMSYEERVWKNWVFVFLFFQFFLWFPYYLTIFWINKALTYDMVNTSVSIWLAISSFSFFLYPSLVYGQYSKSNNNPVTTRDNEKKLHKETDLSDPKLVEIMQLIESKMVNGKLFLKQEYNISDFSRDTQIPVYQISKSINLFCGMGFVDFINQKRIQFCVEKINNGDWLNYKVEAIAQKCGFNNRNSFTNAFKKFMNTLPSDFITSIKTNLV